MAQARAHSGDLPSGALRHPLKRPREQRELLGSGSHVQPKRVKCVTMADYAAQLDQLGYAVVPLLDEKQLAAVELEWPKMIDSFPEFKRQQPDPLTGVTPQLRPVMGGFGAFGNPSSFHTRLVRALRMQVHRVALPLFGATAAASRGSKDEKGQDSKAKVEQLFDRVLQRPAGEHASPEAWHFDMLPAKVSGVGYGGWINLNRRESHYFSCLPGSHLEKFSDKDGFVKFTKEDIARLKFKERREAAGPIECPPGHWIVFRQNIVHEIVAKPRPFVMRRLFVGFRVTDSDQPAFPDLDQIIENQGVPSLPSGEKPPMYAKLHWSNWIDRLVQWSTQNVKPELLEHLERSGKPVVVAPRFIKSLAELKLPLYRAYTAQEKALFRPHTSCDLLDVNWDDLDDISSFSTVSMF